MNIAYLINQYPKISHVFIRREMLALERRGVNILRIALRGWNDEIVDPEDEIERQRTTYVLRDGVTPIIWSIASAFWASPRRAGNAFLTALRLGWKAQRRWPVHIMYFAEACRTLQILREKAVDHLHVHFGTNSAEIALLVNVLGGPSWSFTMHGPEEYDNVALVHLKEKIERASFVVAIASFGRSQLFRLVPHEYWSKIGVVRCGLDFREFNKHSTSPSNRARFACVGRLCEQKGQLLLIDAARDLDAEGVEFELVLVGDGELRGEIERLIDRYALWHRVRITGRIATEELHNELLDAAALVLPSFAEGLPMVIMEAMALGRPVISTYVAGIPELVTSGIHGWLVPAGDVQSLVDAMRLCLLAPPELLAQMGKAAQDRVSQLHDVDVQAAQLEKMFSGTVASAKPAYAESRRKRSFKDPK